MGSGIVQIVLGFGLGCIAMAVVWAIVSSAQNKRAERKEASRKGIAAEIGSLCAEVENAISAHKVGTMDTLSLKGLVSSKLEEINTKLRTNMTSLDLFFVKYTEQFVSECTASIAPFKSAAAQSETETGIAITSGSEFRLAETFGEEDKKTTAVPVVISADEQPEPVPAVEEEGPAGAEEETIESDLRPLSEKVEEEAQAAAEEKAAEIRAEAPPVEEAPVKQDAAADETPVEDAPVAQESSPTAEAAPEELRAALEPEEDQMDQTVIQELPAAVQEQEEDQYAQPGPVAETPGLQAPPAPASEEQGPLSPEPQAPETHLGAGEDVERTQIFSRDALMSAMGKSSVLGDDNDGGTEQSALLTSDDSQIGEDFIFSGERSPGTAASPQESAPAAPEQQAPPPPPPAQEQSASAAPAAAEPEDSALQEDSEKESQDDALITGEDVIKKMDAFFGF